MPDRPVILFPSPEEADRTSKTSWARNVVRPKFGRQYNRLQPTFQTLRDALYKKNLIIQESALGINPDFALVFEVVGTVENFYTAVKHCEGLEWMFDIDSEDIAPDEDFYQEKDGKRTEDSLNGKLYCVMTNQQALDQMLSLWNRYQKGEEGVFERGFAGLRDVFTHIKTVRKWDASDRIAETGIVEYWHEKAEIEDNTICQFEIELFYRNEPVKRTAASNAVKQEIEDMGGHILQECVIDEISYHALLVELPRQSITDLVEKYEQIDLVHVDDIMFFRPTCQSAFDSTLDTERMGDTSYTYELPKNHPVAAILDGMPIQNHALLRGRIIVDDPDDFGSSYGTNDRVHGTAMSSLAIYGDLNKSEEAVSHPIYVRPIMKPKQSGFDGVTEGIPDDVLIVDLIHRSIKRIKEGDGDKKAVAPDVHIVNLSIGDPSRQLATSISPLARLIDYLAFKYKILFIISAGNHGNSIRYIKSTFTDFKARSIGQRNKLVWNAIKDNQRNLKVLSPAESINALTIGATYDDKCEVNEESRGLWAVQRGMPSPISAIGRGYRGIITPDLFYPGGRKYIGDNYSGGLKWFNTSREPGCKAAAPFKDGTESGIGFSFGTSDAAAQITHEAINCYDVLNEIFTSENDTRLPRGYEAILIKCMLAHGASWDHVSEELSRVTGDGIKQLSKWIGNGIPNLSLVKECTKERVTLIGFGALKKDKGDVFKLPLHVDFSSRLVKRKLTVTLAYISPIVASKQAYRKAQLWFEIDDNEKRLIPDGARQNSDWRAVRKGTLQHEIFVGENPVVWNDEDLKIKVNCTKDAANLKASETIPYCIFVSFEIAEGLGIDLYSAVKTQIHQRVSIAQA